MSESVEPVDCLIFGCGYLGSRVAERWLQQGRTVAALTRSRGEELTRRGIIPIVGDVCDPQSLTGLPPARTVLYAIGLDRSAVHSMRDVYVTGLTHALQTLTSANRLIYVSSTSVYGQTDGGWVNESSPTEPLEESGRIVLEAEAVLMKLRPDAIRLRFAGIYGPGRLLRERSIREGQSLGGDPDKWLNLIHVDDGAAAVLAAEAEAVPGDLCLVADNEPVSRRDFYTHLAELLHAPAARFVESPASRETHRRIRNQKMIDHLHLALRFPDYRSGLAQAVPAGDPPGS